MKLFRMKTKEPNIDLIESFGKLDLKDGDIVILKHPMILGKNAAVRLREAVEDILKPFNVKIMVIENGMDIGILRPEKANNTRQTIEHE